ncbi:hypothetical protein GYMLUDRAFT_40552 [Collybiopsis luxurians FD-317 M1]|uniref:Golgi apparatus membrane protein TVP38 n=1 Tax=Collybiopsis luxurians FD-317 M1 TaxID=944289 RepID=A0A0D0CWK9_9AGAR|nr:hypothetical protein GYMLUDRAFT_40552 [Collybiopsis luxurians FD-317 M1]
MASNYPAQNLPYDEPSHAQQYWSSNGQYPPSKSSNTAKQGPNNHLSANITFDRPETNRTPSPTPSEMRELQTSAIDFKAMMNWRFWLRREWLWYYVIGVIIVVLSTLMTIFHDQIVNWLHPVTSRIHDLKLGWLIPIGILFVISFPPLFGHEIIAVLCGLVWGLGIGFAIVCAGTFLGEVGNFYAFKYCCRARGDKMEKTKISYACLARVVREGGFKIALIARLSAIPGHFTTAIFSTCGMNIFVFCIAAVLSLPKQFITVYFGVLFGQSGTETTKQKIISDSVVAVTILITIGACWYILRKMNEAKPAVIYDRRKARQAKLMNEGLYSSPSSNNSDTFNPNASETNIPLTAQKPNYGYGAGAGQPYPFSPQYQSSSSGNKTVYAPKPQHHYSQNQYNIEDELVGHVAPGGVSDTSYNYTPTRQTSDEVGYDAAGPSVAVSQQQQSPRVPPGVPNLPRTQSPESIPSQPIPSSSSYPQTHPQPQSSHPYPTPASHYPPSVPLSSNTYTPYSYQPQVVQTHTQGQFGSYNPNATSADRLPTPGFPPNPSSPVATGLHSPTVTGMHSNVVASTPPAQFTTPHAYTSHAYEPTDATYHTAMASSDSAGFPHDSPPRYQS